jgi:hypothetical protein
MTATTLTRPLVKRTVLTVILILLVTVAVRMPVWSIPFERDEGEYAYIAWRMEHQELPYRDWIDQKPPGIFWVYRFALSLPIEPVHAVRLVALLFSAASACALFLLARRFVEPFWAGVAAVLFSELAADPAVQGTAANTELFMLLPLILSNLACLATASAVRPRVRSMILAGALTGMATAFKQVAAVNWLFLVCLYPILVTREKRWSRGVSFVAWSAVGVAAVWGGVAIYFWLRHGLGDLVYNVFTHNLEYASAIPWRNRWILCRDTLALLAPSQSLVWIMSATGLGAALLSRNRQPSVLLAGWTVTSLAGVSASGYYFPHYFQQLLPVLSLAAVFGAQALDVWGLWRCVPTWCRRTMLVIALTVLPAVEMYPFLFVYAPNEAVQKIYPGNYFAEMPEVGRRIADVTGSDDRVFIFGAEAEVLFYARRVSATRYIFLFPLYGPYHDALAKQVAAAQEIARAQPAAVFYLPNQLFLMPGSEQYFTRWSLAYLKENFEVDDWLTVDAGGFARLVPAAAGPGGTIPAREQIRGAILVRKSQS